MPSFANSLGSDVDWQRHHSNVFKKQVKEADSATAVKIPKDFKRIELVVDNLGRHSLDVGKMTMIAKIGGGMAVVVKVLPRENEPIVKK